MGWGGAGAVAGAWSAATARGLDRVAVPAVGAVLGVCYALFYLSDRARPGQDPEHMLGWSGWFDQSMTLRSTVALLGGTLDASQHHYPLAYSLMAVPFEAVTPGHAFFVVDLVSLLAALCGFVALGRRLGLGGAAAAAVFAFGVLSTPAVFRQWVLPWNTTPAAACLWLLLAATAAWLDGTRRPVGVGVLMGLVVACRPSDAVVLLPCAGAILWAERRGRPGWAGAAVRVAAGGAAVVLPVAALHVAIYGWAQSPYMVASARLGFTADGFGWKTFVLWADPFAWFADGQGLLQRSRWVAVGLLGVVPALLRGAKDRVLALTLLVHAALYVSYVDLLPTGLWRFFNVHYFTWAYPGYALLAVLLGRDVVRRGAARWAGLVGAGLTVPVLCLQVVPVPAGDGTAKAADFAGPVPGFSEAMFGDGLRLRDEAGELATIVDFRALPYPGGVRAVAVRRAFVGRVEWVAGHAPGDFGGVAAGARWGTAVRVAWPPAWWRRARETVLALPRE